MEKMEYKSFRGTIERKEDGDGKMRIRAYALAFGNVDSWGDVIEPGACDDWLKSEDARRVRLCYQHEKDDVIGVITDKGVDAIGMWFEADILPTTLGKDVQILLKEGAIDEFSIGYRPVRWDYQMEGDETIRHLKAIDIIEVSPVTRAANPKAVLLDIKSDDGRSAIHSMTDSELLSLRDAVSEECARRIIRNL